MRNIKPWRNFWSLYIPFIHSYLTAGGLGGFVINHVKAEMPVQDSSRSEFLWLLSSRVRHISSTGQTTLISQIPSDACAHYSQSWTKSQHSARTSRKLPWNTVYCWRCHPQQSFLENSLAIEVDQPSSASFTPFAARTQQYVKEQLGQVEDKVR